MTTTIEFITALFCQVDDHLPAIPKHPEAHLWPSEVLTLVLRFIIDVRVMLPPVGR
jgi:hypothetical protein